MTIHGQTFFHFHEGRYTGHFRNDWVRVWIPLSDYLTGFNRISFGNRYHSSVRQLVTLPLTTVLICYSNGAGPGNSDQLARLAFDGLQIVQANGAAVFNLNVIYRSSTRCRTTDVEGTHG